jgi:DNA-binding PucR family transcriptional regulator
MNEHLEMSEQCVLNSQVANDANVRSIFARMSELYRLLHEEEERLADWLKSQDPSSIPNFIYKRPRD